jgi:hypothetical protein
MKGVCFLPDVTRFAGVVSPANLAPANRSWGRLLAGAAQGQTGESEVRRQAVGIQLRRPCASLPLPPPWSSCVRQSDSG